MESPRGNDSSVLEIKENKKNDMRLYVRDAVLCRVTNIHNNHKQSSHKQVDAVRESTEYLNRA